MITRALLPGLLAVSAVSAAVPQTVFRGGVDVVMVNVAVRQSGRIAGGLAARDFELRDNGVLQTLDDVQFASVPIEATMLVDLSGSVSGTLLSSLTRAVGLVKRQVQPADVVHLVQFDHHIRQLAAAVPGDTDVAALLSPGQGDTALFDAMAAALIRPSRSTHRQMLLVFTDGADTVSFLDAGMVREIAPRADPSIFVVALAARGRTPPHDALFETLAEMTGGRFTAVNDVDTVGDSFVRALDEFRSSYTRYSMTSASQRGWHDIAVRITRPGGYKVRARRGYERGR